MGAAPANRAPVVAIIALTAVPFVSHLVIVVTQHIRLGLALNFFVLFKLGFVTASAAAHWAIYGGLLVAFGLTLRPGHEPLITTLARAVQSEMPDELARYTRRVTMAWTVFFAAQLTISVTLFLLAPLVVWSFFVNILDIPLVVTMFAVEYAIRLRVLRNPPRHSLAGILKMVAEIRKPDEKVAVCL